MPKAIVGVFVLVLLTISGVPCLAEQWLLFSLPERPYYNRHGEEVAIKGRRNIYGRDEFYGGGRVHPSTTGAKVLKRYEQDGKLLMLLDTTPEETVSQEPGTYRVVQNKGRLVSVSPVKSRVVPFQEFRPKVLSELEAQALLVQWGFATAEPPETGVTK